ncbi:MAG TPA: dihydrofolate reductase [Burkholderiaceae bacterium]|nr:dihydrofolate reductase [Burkholderiaceae bacterium]
MQLNLIYAKARNGVIGKDGKMPWHLPEDLAYLKRMTLGCPVIMGRKTWDSLPPKFRPLPGRTNVVITRQENWHEDGALPAHNLPEALSICEHMSLILEPSPDQVWVLGGAQIYQQALPFAQQVCVTEIDADFEGDAFAPVLDKQWQETSRESHTSTSGLAYSFVTYTRVKASAHHGTDAGK